MTANAIAYRVALESERHNRVMESLEMRKREIERLSFLNQQRATSVESDYKTASIKESYRHNTAVEDETRTNNNALRYLEYLKQQETRRNNVALETIKANEASIGWMNARTNQTRAETERGQLKETTRANLAREALNERSQIEVERANREHERLTARGQDLGVYNVQTQASATRYAAGASASATRYAAELNQSTQQYVTDAKIAEEGRQFDLKLPVMQQEADSKSQDADTRSSQNDLAWENAWLNNPEGKLKTWSTFWGSMNGFLGAAGKFLAP